MRSTRLGLPRKPRSHTKAVRPARLSHWPKYAFWRIAAPLHPYIRDLSVRLGLVDFDQFLDHKGRQKFLLGMLAPSVSADDIVEYLMECGYGHNHVAWEDNGEVASLRLADGFRYQYHIRIFSDGEVRGHYEHTPEAHPLKHYYEVGMEERRDYFLAVLGEHIVPA